jgi:hypothetical protein
MAQAAGHLIIQGLRSPRLHSTWAAPAQGSCSSSLVLTVLLQLLLAHGRLLQVRQGQLGFTQTICWHPLAACILHLARARPYSTLQLPHEVVMHSKNAHKVQQQLPLLLMLLLQLLLLQSWVPHTEHHVTHIRPRCLK